MSRFDVWAPKAGSVGLTADGQDFAMERADGGWWRLPAGAAVPGGEVDYGYRIDGAEKPLPDPRSRRQPDGVHGAVA
ncbi:maltooligosyl trehalose trehalohydrolase, partial [Arthrobacter crystallopoietes BAB-32]